MLTLCLTRLLQSVKNLPGIGGIMLWDVSWDQNNVINGQRYSEYAFKELGGLTNTVPPVTTQAPPPPVTTEGPNPSVTTQAPPPPVTTHAPPPPTGKCHCRDSPKVFVIIMTGLISHWL